MKIEKRIKRKREFPKRIDVRFSVFRNWKFPRFDDSSRFLPNRHLTASISLVGQWDWLDPSIRNRVSSGRVVRGEEAASSGHLSWAAPWIMGFVDELNPIGPVFNSLARRLTRERRLLVGAAPVVLALPVVVKYRSLWGESSTRPPLCPPLLLSLRVPRLVAS